MEQIRQVEEVATNADLLVRGLEKAQANQVSMLFWAGHPVDHA